MRQSTKIPPQKEVVLVSANSLNVFRDREIMKRRIAAGREIRAGGNKNGNKVNKILGRECIKVANGLGQDGARCGIASKKWQSKN